MMWWLPVDLKEKNDLHGFFSLSFNSLNLKIVLFTAFQVITAALVPAQKNRYLDQSYLFV